MTDRPDDEILAGEYVLGLIDGEERRAFERRLERDATLAAAVTRWQAHLAPIDTTAASIQPHPELWRRIERALDALPAARATRPSQRSVGERIALWWDHLPLWRGAAAAGALASLCLAIGLAASLHRGSRQPVMVAVLLTDTNVAAGVVNTFADGRVELLPLQDIAVPQGRALEIWTLWDRAAGPRSVGLIERARAAPLHLENLPLGADQLFEITLEPASGSPTGRPTGPIVAKGLTSRRL